MSVFKRSFLFIDPTPPPPPVTLITGSLLGPGRRPDPRLVPRLLRVWPQLPRPPGLPPCLRWREVLLRCPSLSSPPRASAALVSVTAPLIEVGGGGAHCCLWFRVTWNHPHETSQITRMRLSHPGCWGRDRAETSLFPAPSTGPSTD